MSYKPSYVSCILTALTTKLYFIHYIIILVFSFFVIVILHILYGLFSCYIDPVFYDGIIRHYDNTIYCAKKYILKVVFTLEK